MGGEKVTDHAGIIRQLKLNCNVFRALFTDVTEVESRWRPAPDKWCLLEIVCHLYDEECEDFRARVKHVLETPGQPMQPIDPAGWVEKRRYMELDFKEMTGRWAEARLESVSWLEGLRNPRWENAYLHPKLGPMSAELFLSNWLAHDYLHIRQITRLKYAYLKEKMTGKDLGYAGIW